jgi:hypothetical protein
LPDDVVNAAVMNPMIKRWRSVGIMTFRPFEFKIFNNLNALSTDEIEALLSERVVDAKAAKKAERNRHERKTIQIQRFGAGEGIITNNYK